MRTFTRGGLSFDVNDIAASAPDRGQVVVLLHGWPQNARAWDLVSPALAAAGHRVLAPTQRGYSPGARPRQVSAYAMTELVADVAALVEAAGAERVHLVGHDWGGAVAWAMAQARPDLLASLTVLSTPHHRAMAWAMRHGGQLRRSWYMVGFQVPVVPDAVIAARPRTLLTRIGVAPERVELYAEDLGERDHVRATLAWYRAMRLRPPGGQGQPGSEGDGRITVPTTYLWGRRDPAFTAAAARRTGRYVAADYREVPVDADHWLPEKEPDLVAREILARMAAAGS